MLTPVAAPLAPAPAYPPSVDIRQIVRTRMVEWHGGEAGAQSALAAACAPRWGISPDSAKSRLSRWFADREPGVPAREITSVDLAHVFDALELDLVPRRRAR